MNIIRKVEERRAGILEELAGIRSLKQATLKEQMLPVKHKGKKEPVLRGPYYVLARWENGKTRSRRVRAGEVEQVRKDVDNHRRFKALCKELAELTEQLGHLERECGASEEALKKGLKSKSRKARR